MTILRLVPLLCSIRKRPLRFSAHRCRGLVGCCGVINTIQQIAAVPKQTLNVVQALQLVGIALIAAGDLQIQGRQPLLQPHQPLGQRMDGFGQVLGIAADAEGD